MSTRPVVQLDAPAAVIRAQYARAKRCPVCEVSIIWTGPNTGTCVCTGDER